MTDDQQPAPTIGVVVGENLRRLRQRKRWTQAQAATEVQLCGLNWKRTHVSDLEARRRETLDAGALVILAAALEVRVPELLEGEGDVLLTPRGDMPAHGATATREQLRAWYSGEASDVLLTGSETSMAAVDRAEWQGRPIAAEADRALARKLGVDPWKVVRAAEQLWSRSLTEERDRRVSELGELPLNERQARQGHITRQLTSVLTKWMDAEGETLEEGDEA